MRINLTTAIRSELYFFIICSGIINAMEEFYNKYNKLVSDDKKIKYFYLFNTTAESVSNDGSHDVFRLLKFVLNETDFKNSVLFARP